METAAKRRLDGAAERKEAEAEEEEEEAERQTKRPRDWGDDEGERQATEEEVEEFFAILRRVRDARRCMGRGRAGDGTGVRTTSATWQPKFVREDFKEMGDVRDDSAKVTEEEVVENVVQRGFDLNAEPVAEDVAAKP